jgi:6-phosphogluconolactonase/glucosamine-6-phosphate isomerase/deaminase
MFGSFSNAAVMLMRVAMHLCQPQQKQMRINLIHCLRCKGDDRAVPADSADGNTELMRHAVLKISAGNKHHPNRSLANKGPKRAELAGALGSDEQRNTALNW